MKTHVALVSSSYQRAKNLLPFLPDHYEYFVVTPHSQLAGQRFTGVVDMEGVLFRDKKLFESVWEHCV